MNHFKRPHSTTRNNLSPKRASQQSQSAINLDIRQSMARSKRRTTATLQHADRSTSKNNKQDITATEAENLNLIVETNSMDGDNSDRKDKKSQNAQKASRTQHRSSYVVNSSMDVGRPPRAGIRNTRSSTGLMSAGKKVVGTRSSRQGMSDMSLGEAASSKNATTKALVPMGVRQRATLQNPDGTEMTTQDLITATNDMKATGGPVKIANFGLDQSSLEQFHKEEAKNKKVK